MKETELVKMCIELLRLKGCMAWRQNTGVMRKTYRGKSRVVRFGTPGMSDILGVLPGGRILAVECKVGTGKETLSQFAFQEAVRAIGGWAVVVRSVHQLVKSLEATVDATG